MKISTKELIQSIHSKLKNYRAHEHRTGRISAQHIARWVKQFDKRSRLPILHEVNNIFKKRYFSRQRVKRIFHELIIELAKEFRFKLPANFLKNCQFLNLQPNGKSQGDMLDLMDGVLQQNFNIKLSECGSQSHRYSIYLDDILCTGNTLHNNLRSWLGQNFVRRKTNLNAVKDGSTKLLIFYLFLHQRGWYNKLKQIRHEFPNILKNIHLYREVEINNNIHAVNELDLIYPIKSKNETILEYLETVDEQVSCYIECNDYSNSVRRYFRNPKLPWRDQFFTSPKQRTLIEQQFLLKGIEILNGVNVMKKNIRALGYSLPSERNFGFGALCFTWRNISNTTPLVFWYSANDSFVPLFPRLNR